MTLLGPKIGECAVCAGRDLAPDFTAVHPPGIELAWSRCRGCGFTFMNPKLERAEMRKLYDSDRYWNGMSYDHYVRNEAVRLANGRRRLDTLSRYLPPGGSLLDVGCATGFFAAAASERGFRATGIDPAAELVGFGRREYGLDLRPQTVEEASFPAASFDVISLFGTDSHFHDPHEAFRRMTGWLKPGGIFLFTYQNYASRLRWLFPTIKQRSNCYYNFTRKSFRLFLGQIGLRLLRETTDRQITQIHRITRTLGLSGRLLRRLDDVRITVPALSFRLVVATKCA